MTRLDRPSALRRATDTIASTAARPAARVAAAAAQGGEPSCIETALVPAHRARRASERAGDFVLLRKSLRDQRHHRVRAGHTVAGVEVR